MDESARSNGKARIEGGMEAVVVGASPDGLVAAAYLARAGLKTVLFEASTEIGAAYRWEAQDGEEDALYGEHLFHALDPQMIDDLDLYSCGVSYGARRMRTRYYFADAAPLELSGDLRAAAADAGPDGEAYARFIVEMFEAAVFLRPMLAGAPGANTAFRAAFDGAPSHLAQSIERWMIQSAECAVASYFPEGPMRMAMLAEAAFRNGAPPNEPMSFASLLVRWAGETSGLQGAVGLAEGGASSVIDALRRAAQKAGVEFRLSSPAAKILIEKDCAAGVELKSGDQTRAPIVISALDARSTFLGLIGAASLDRAFQKSITMRKPSVAAAHLIFELSGPPMDVANRDDLACRMIYAPAPDLLRRAFLKAGDGEIPAELIVEAVYLDACSKTPATGAHRLSVLVHPVPNIRKLSKENRSALCEVVIAAVENIVPGVSALISSTQMTTPARHVAAESVCRQIARAAMTSSAGTIGGLYFCGPEAQIGYGVNGAAGRNAALAALHKASRAGAAA